MLFDFIKKFNSQKTDKNYINYKFVHFVVNDKFILPFIDLMNKNFNNKQHCFIYFQPTNSFKIPVEYKNVIVVQDSENLKFNLKKIKKIFVHSMPPYMSQFLFNQKELLKLCYWIIWGYDIYNDDNEIGHYVKNNVKAVITNFDKSTYQNRYNQNTTIYEMPFYPSVIKKEYLDKVSEKKDNDYITVQINNSADPSTLDMLEILSKFKDENIKICTILSYAKTQYNDTIIKKGHDLFNDKFIAITKYLNPEEYAEHIKRIDVLVLNQNRQQGVGNIRCNMYLGHKVFIRGEITTYKGFIKQGFKVFDTDKIKEMDFKDFILLEEKDKQNNKNLLSGYFDNSDIINSWKYFYKIN